MKPQTAIVIVVALLLVAYSGYKASSASFTHDESFSYLEYASGPYGYILFPGDRPVSANNHLLNSVLMKLSASVFGTSELSLRLHSVLAHMLFLLFGWLLVRRLRDQLMVPAFLLLVVNPYLLDFFALARGYGMALAFTLGTLYFLLEFAQHQRLKVRVFMLLMAALAVLSNFTSLYLMLAVMGVSLLFVLRKPLLYWVEMISFDAAMLGVLAALVVPHAKLLQERGQLYFGGQEGFWEDTVQSLVQSSFYTVGVPAWVHLVVVGLIALALLGATVSLVSGWRRAGTAALDLNRMGVLWAVLVLLGVGICLNFYLLNARFVIHRTALFLLPIFVLMLCYWFDAMTKTPRISTVMAVLAGVMVVHTLATQRPDAAIDWGYDSKTREAVELLGEEVATSGIEQPVKVGSNGLFAPTINFYRKTLELGWLTKVSRDGLQENGNYNYAFERWKNRPDNDPQEIFAYSEVGLSVIRWE